MLAHDLLLAVRRLAKSPGFTAVAVLTLALGIGVNTAIFSVLKVVVLEPLAFPGAGRLAAVNTRWIESGRLGTVSGPDFHDIERRIGGLEAAAYWAGGEAGVQAGDVSEFGNVYMVSGAYFQVFTAAPIAGRLLGAEDSHPAPDTAVIGEPFAVRHFGSAAGAAGQTIRFQKRAYTIVGVLPKESRYPLNGDIWVPADPSTETKSRTAHNYRAVAKLRPGSTWVGVNSELSALGEALAHEFPGDNSKKSFLATPLKDSLVARSGSTLYLLMAAVGLILLIACANVAHLLLTRASGKVREYAVRIALGAGRGRIVREVLLESLILAGLAALAAVLLAETGLRLLVALAPADIPRLAAVRLDLTVLGFTGAVAVLASLISGLAPAWHASRIDVSDSLKQGGSRGIVGSGGPRHALIATEVALAFVLAVSAGLLLRSFHRLASIHNGYRGDGVLVMYANVPANTDPEYHKAIRQFEQLLPLLAAIPGVESSAAVMGLPTGQYGSNGGYVVEGRQDMKTFANLPNADFSLASPGYFKTLGIPILRGRDFQATDVYDRPFVAVISESLARQSFAGQDPIGKRLMCGLDSPNWMTIVGVVGDVRQTPSSKPGPVLYMPFQQHPYHANELQLVLRTGVPPESLALTATAAVRDFSPEIAVKTTTLRRSTDASVALPRFRTWLLALFAALALTLAAVGIYGVLSFLAEQRRAEFGLRLALGATRPDILRQSLKRAGRYALAGLAAGAALAWAAQRSLSAMLAEISPNDPVAYLSAFVVLGLVAVAAAVVPALRSAQVDPATALRTE